MLKPIDQWYLDRNEPVGSYLQFLRSHILKHDPEIIELWRYGAPFFYYRKKMFCYFWINKKTGQPYIGWVEGNQLNHPQLIQEKRSRMKILPLEVEKDVPVRIINKLLREAIAIIKKR